MRNRVTLIIVPHHTDIFGVTSDRESDERKWFDSYQSNTRCTVLFCAELWTVFYFVVVLLWYHFAKRKHYHLEMEDVQILRPLIISSCVCLDVWRTWVVAFVASHLCDITLFYSIAGDVICVSEYFATRQSRVFNVWLGNGTVCLVIMMCEIVWLCLGYILSNVCYVMITE